MLEDKIQSLDMKYLCSISFVKVMFHTSTQQTFSKAVITLISHDSICKHASPCSCYEKHK